MGQTFRARTLMFAISLGVGCAGNSGPPQVILVPSQGVAGQGAASPLVNGQAGSTGIAPAVAAQTPAAGDVGFATTVQPFINKACNCHQSTPILMAPFSMKVGEAYANLVNVPSIQVSSMVRVKPGSIDQSYLWHKVDGTQLQVGGSGMIMPSTIPLNADEKMIFQRWIAAGAPP